MAKAQKAAATRTRAARSKKNESVGNPVSVNGLKKYTVNLAVKDVAALKKIAARKDVPYQVFVREQLAKIAARG